MLPGGPRDMGRTGRAFDGKVRELILRERPHMIGFAKPFVGMKGGLAVNPDSIRPLFGLMTVLEMIADELKFPCREAFESDARKAFLGNVPSKSADIKKAVRAACVMRGWPARDHHAADALCVASHILSCIEPASAATLTPLFAESST